MEAQKIAQIPWYDWRKVLANEPCASSHSNGFQKPLKKCSRYVHDFTAKINWKDLIIMAISHYRKQRIMLLARLNLGLASEDKEEIDLYNHYQKNIYLEQNQQQQ